MGGMKMGVRGSCAQGNQWERGAGWGPEAVMQDRVAVPRGRRQQGLASELASRLALATGPEPRRRQEEKEEKGCRAGCSTERRRSEQFSATQCRTVPIGFVHCRERCRKRCNDHFGTPPTARRASMESEVLALPSLRILFAADDPRRDASCKYRWLCQLSLYCTYSWPLLGGSSASVVSLSRRFHRLACACPCACRRSASLLPVAAASFPNQSQ